MTEEIIKLKCPSCQHFLLEEEYYDACQEIRILANQMAKEALEVHISELELEERKVITRINHRLPAASEDSGFSIMRDK